jgi:hypothetical protein
MCFRRKKKFAGVLQWWSCFDLGLAVSVLVCSCSCKPNLGLGLAVRVLRDLKTKTNFDHHYLAWFCWRHIPPGGQCPFGPSRKYAFEYSYSHFRPLPHQKKTGCATGANEGDELFSRGLSPPPPWHRTWKIQ